MRRLVLIGGIALLVALAGCAADDTDDGTDDIADDVSDFEDAADENGGDDREDANDTESSDDPDRDTDDDPPPGDEADDAAPSNDDASSADDGDDGDDRDDAGAEDDDGGVGQGEADDHEPAGNLEIHHIDVGQADATLIITPEGETVLIDSGDWRQGGSEVIEYLEAHDVDRIDHLIATHAHADHIGGHDAVIQWAETEGDGIGAAYDSGVPHTTATFDRYLDTISEFDVELFTVEEGNELPLESDGVSGVFLNPPAGDSGDDLHYNSIAIAIEYGEFRYLTTGDAEADAEERLVTDWADELPADVYQVGHHGSSTSSSQAFLDAVDPEYAVISSDYDSDYGHPHDEVLERFDDAAVETYWTGVHGHVIVTTDGETVDVSPSEAFSTAPADLLAEKPSDDDGPNAAQNDIDDGDDVSEDENEATDPTEHSTAVADALNVVDLNVDGVSPDEEYIVIENTGDKALDLGEWQIRDREEDGQVAGGLSPFVFPVDFELGPDDRVTIWTGEGENTDTDRYWDYGVNIWRGEGDVVILIDPDGEYVFEYAYGDHA